MIFGLKRTISAVFCGADKNWYKFWYKIFRAITSAPCNKTQNVSVVKWI